MSTDDGKRVAQEWADAMQRLREERDDLVRAVIRLRELDVNCSQAEDRAAWADINAALARVQR